MENNMDNKEIKIDIDKEKELKISKKKLKIFIEKEDASMNVVFNKNLLELRAHRIKDGKIYSGISISLPNKLIGLLVNKNGDVKEVYTGKGVYNVTMKKGKDTEDVQVGDLFGYIIFYNSLFFVDYIFTKFLNKYNESNNENNDTDNNK